MNTKLVNSAADVILSAIEQNRTAAGIALALDSAGFLKTQTPTAYRVLDGITTVALYTSAEQARKHCDFLARREIVGTGAPHLYWTEDEDTRDQPDEGPMWLMHQVSTTFARPTGFSVMPIPLATAFDPDADE